ncbi:MAG: heavy-metal-associated domain-containing protein [Bryobacterales bacterium]|nr:heavy-metal-associated domain-containing protein [Bryobacterales bacterium]
MRFLFPLLLCLGPLPAEYLRIEQSFAAMDCASCAGFIQKKLARNPGVESVNVDRKKNVVTVALKPGNKVRLRQVRDFVEQSGFKPREAEVVVLGTASVERGITTLKIADSEDSIRLRDPDTRMREYITKKVEIKGMVESVMSQGSRIDILEVREAKVVK